MTIIQISKIKNRRGPRNNLPQLDEGEFGFTVDTGELFIGGPNVPVIKRRGDNNEFPYSNVAVLTETTDNIGNYLDYTFRDRFVQLNTSSAKFVPLNTNANAVLEYFDTGTSSWLSTVVKRKLQEKLDDCVSVKDYGALGEGTFQHFISPGPLDQSYLNAETAAIRRAAIDVCNTFADKTMAYGFHPKKLFFPAGIYMINDPILIPPYAHFVGEGPTNTIIALVDSKSGASRPEFRCVAFTVDESLSHSDINNNAAILNHSYSNMTFSSSYVLNERTIILENMTFIVAINPLTKAFRFDVLRLFNAKNVILKNCRIIGNWGYPFIGGSNPSYEFKHNANGNYYYEDSVGIVFDSYDKYAYQYKPENLIIENCMIGNVAYGIIATDDIKNIYVRNSLFNRLYRGISINEPLIVSSGNLSYMLTRGNRGPKNVVIDGNYFINIKREAISNFSNVVHTKNSFDNYNKTTITSINNYFENVGNNKTNNGIMDETSFTVSPPVSPVINFGNAEYSSSVNDQFSRNFEEEKTGTPFGSNISRVYHINSKSLVLNTDEIKLPKREIVLTSSTTSFTDTGIIFNVNTSPRAVLEFGISVDEGGIKRRREGKAVLVMNSTNVNMIQDFVDVGTVNVELSAFGPISSNVYIKYKNLHSTNAILYFRIDYDRD